MNRFLSIFLRVFLTINISAIAWFVSFFSFDQPFLFSIGFSIVGGIFTYWISSVFLNYRLLKRHRLTRKEYRYIQKNMDEAKRKLFRLHKALMSIRHLWSLKQRIELVKMTRKIYTLTKKEPTRFYKAERFYFSHLDSAVELSEKYVFLSGQPKKNQEIDRALYETRRTLEELTGFIENDLYELISEDIDQLYFEIDVAKHSINKTKDSQIIGESGRLK